MASRTRARDRQLPAIQWAIIGAGMAAGLLTLSASTRVVIGEQDGVSTAGWWTVWTTAPAALAAAVCLVLFFVAAISRSVKVRARSMWAAMAADVAASAWIGGNGVMDSVAELDKYAAIALGGSLTAALVLTVPVISAVAKDRAHAREKAAEDSRLAAWLAEGDAAPDASPAQPSTT